MSDVKILKRSFTIPAGTVFHKMDGRTTEHCSDNYVTTFALSKDTGGEIVCSIDSQDQAMDYWFEEDADE